MENKKSKSLCMISLYRQFVRESLNGKRLQKNGSRIRKSTIRNYENVLQLLQKFSSEESFELRIVPTTKLRKSEFKAEQNYWKNFYTRFIAFLFSKGAHDNYAGAVFKTIKVFFNYIEQEKNISINGLHKKFFVVQNEPPIYTLDAQQLQLLIYDEEFEQRLDYLQKLTKDIFVFGATVALRISDLMNLKQHNIIEVNGNVYLRTSSIKTNTFSQVKLPEYALQIIHKYNNKRGYFLFPHIYLNTFNDHLKEIGELAGWTHLVEKQRFKRGLVANASNMKMRFCDLMSSHMMRKTAITNMLVHQVDETIVRKISGHAPGSKEFYRYVNYAQTLIDDKTDHYFEAISQPKNMQKNMKIV